MIRANLNLIESETVSDAHLIEPTDAIVCVTRAAICGSHNWQGCREA